MKNLFNVFIYEYKKIFSDLGAVLILLIAPIFYSFFYPFPYEKEVIKKVPVAIIDEDKSDLSKKIVRMFNATEYIEVNNKYLSLNEAKNDIYKRKIFGIIYIPKDFYKNVIKNQKPNITLFSDGSYMLFYSETFSTAMKVVLTVSAGIKIQRMTMQGVMEEEAINIWSLVQGIQKPLFNSVSGYGVFVVTGVLSLILQQIILVAMMLVFGRGYEEKSIFLKDSSLIPNFIGKSLTYLSFFFLIAFYFFYISIKFFNIPDFSKPFQLPLFLVPYGLSVVFLGLSATFFVRERQAGVFFIIMTSIPLLFLVGFAWPTWEMPSWLQIFRLIFPSSAGVLGIIAIRQLGASIDSIMPMYINLWILTFIYMFFALISLKYKIKEEKRHII